MNCGEGGNLIEALYFNVPVCDPCVREVEVRVARAADKRRDPGTVVEGLRLLRQEQCGAAGA